MNRTPTSLPINLVPREEITVFSSFESKLNSRNITSPKVVLFTARTFFRHYLTTVPFLSHIAYPKTSEIALLLSFIKEY